MRDGDRREYSTRDDAQNGAGTKHLAAAARRPRLLSTTRLTTRRARTRIRDGDGVETVGSLTSGIKNKQRRSEVYGKLRHERAVAKKKRREARQKAEAEAIDAGEEPAPRQIPKTIENQRVRDATFIEDADDVDVAEQDAEDEFASYF